MGSKKKSKTGKGSKVSLSKLSNKHLNKLAKQGKLKKKLGKRYVQFLKEKTSGKAYDPVAAEEERQREAEDTPDIPLEEADYEYFATPGRDLSFLEELEEEPRKKRRKTKDDGQKEEEMEEGFEDQVRKKASSRKEQKALLPIKSKEGVIPRSEDIEEENSEDDADEEAEEKEDEVLTAAPSEPLPTLSTAELYAQRQQKLLDRKQKIAVLSSSIIESPEQNYTKLKELRLLLEESEADIQITVKKLVMASLTEVFKDIIPAYRIRIASEAEKAQPAKKETKQLRAFEESLLKNYRNFLEFLELVIKGKPVKSKKKKVPTATLR